MSLDYLSYIQPKYSYTFLKGLDRYGGGLFNLTNFNPSTSYMTTQTNSNPSTNITDGLAVPNPLSFSGETVADKRNKVLSYTGAGLSAATLLADSFISDKNFGSLSAAIDAGVHGISSALMLSGNPYAMAAAGALEGANFLTKAGGQTVQGYDVDINNSGYGTLDHMESSSSRDFGALIGLGGLNNSTIQRKLTKRNLQAMMALKAASISEDQSFELEARQNKILNTLMKNQQALSGGLATDLLGA